MKSTVLVPPVLCWARRALRNALIASVFAACFVATACADASPLQGEDVQEVVPLTRVVASDDGTILAAFGPDHVNLRGAPKLARGVYQIWSYPVSHVVDRTKQNELLYHFIGLGVLGQTSLEAIDLGSGKPTWRVVLAREKGEELATVWSFASYTHAGCIAISAPRDIFIDHASREEARLPRAVREASGVPACIQTPSGLRTAQFEVTGEGPRIIFCSVQEGKAGCAPLSLSSEFTEASRASIRYIRADGGIVSVTEDGLFEVQLTHECMFQLRNCNTVQYRSVALDSTMSKPNQVSTPILIPFDVSDDGLTFAGTVRHVDRCPGESLLVKARRESEGLDWTVEQACVSGEFTDLRVIDGGAAIAAYENARMLWRR